MRGDDGILLPSVGEFFEVVPPSRIVFSSDLEDGNGNKLIEVVNTITLEEEGSRTRMILHIKVTRAVPEVADKLGDMEMGWSESLERFEAEVAVPPAAADGAATEIRAQDRMKQSELTGA